MVANHYNYYLVYNNIERQVISYIYTPDLAEDAEVSIPADQ